MDIFKLCVFPVAWLVIFNLHPLPHRKTYHNLHILQLSLVTDYCLPLESSCSLHPHYRYQT
ncbi:hypothetical protein M758_11G146100 [Ceratodon purpureus]|nr:hypothetical protein M758_11G146100 [Ceratodon purpureus]